AFPLQLATTGAFPFPPFLFFLKLLVPTEETTDLVPEVKPLWNALEVTTFTSPSCPSFFIKDW
ncbi:MAG: hypothetical protein Q8847_02540, partial [Sweet potato little leaf phytoplasma]|nr:hypothetical protein [Sweet potato little leaf phytoplasma]